MTLKIRYYPFFFPMFAFLSMQKTQRLASDLRCQDAPPDEA